MHEEVAQSSAAKTSVRILGRDVMAGLRSLLLKVTNSMLLHLQGSDNPNGFSRAAQRREREQFQAQEAAAASSSATPAASAAASGHGRRRGWPGPAPGNREDRGARRVHGLDDLEVASLHVPNGRDVGPRPVAVDR